MPLWRRNAAPALSRIARTRHYPALALRRVYQTYVKELQLRCAGVEGARAGLLQYAWRGHWRRHNSEVVVSAL